MSDICSKRQPLFLSAISFQLAGASFLIAAPSLAYYIAGVAIAGCSSAFVWASSLALVLESTPEHHIASSMSYVGLSISCAAFIGPVLGGVIYQEGGHFAVWAMCFGLVGVDLVLRLIMIEPKALPPATDSENGRSCPSEVIGLQHPINDVSAASEFPASFHRESSSDWRPGIFKLLKSPRFSFAVVATICLATAVTSFDGVLPIYVNSLFAFTSTETGLLYLAVAVPAFIQPLVGRWIDKHGGRFIGPASFLLSCPAFVCLRFVDQDSTNHKVLLVFILVIIGALMTAGIPVYMAEVSYVVLDTEKPGSSMRSSKCAFAQAHSLWSAGYSIGCTLGPLWGGWIQHKAGWRTETWTVALLCGIAGVLAVVLTGPERPKH